MTTRLLHPRATVTVAGTTVPAESADVTLDESWAPYAQGQVVVPFDDPAQVVAIDPRASQRARIDATAEGSYTVTPPEYSPWVEARRNRATVPVPTATYYGTSAVPASYPISFDATGGRRGGGASKLVRTTSAPGTVLAQANSIGHTANSLTGRIPVVAGTTYTVSTYVKVSAPVTLRARIELIFYDAAGVLISPTVAGVYADLPNNDWGRIFNTAPAHAGAATMMIRVLVTAVGYTSQGGETTWITDTLMETAAAVGDYFDGNTPDPDDLTDYAWTGTADISASTMSTRTVAAAGAVWTPGPARTFDLGIRFREVDYRASLCTLHLASDEALLQDWAPLAEDRGPLNRQKSLYAICDYVIGRATGNLVPESAPVTDASGVLGYVTGGTGGTYTLARLTTPSAFTPTPWYWRITLTGGTGPFTQLGIRNSATPNRAPVTAGRTYSGKVWVHTPARKRLSVKFEFRDAASTVVGSMPYVESDASGWREVILPAAVAPAGAVSVDIDVRQYLDAPVVNDQINVTDFKVAEGQLPPSSLSGQVKADDVDATRYWDATNHATNPNGQVNADDWAISSNAGSLTALTMSTPLPPVGTRAVRWAATAAGTTTVMASGYSTSANKTSGMRVDPGRQYSAAAAIYTASSTRSAQVGITFMDAAGKFLTGRWSDAVPGSGAFTQVRLTAPAPANAVTAVVYVRVTNAAAGGLYYATNIQFNDGAEPVPFFAGDTPDAGGYFYDWTGDPNASASERDASPWEAEPDALIWRPGTNGWDFLEPVLSAYGRRLFCDELRVWRLVEPAFSVGSTVNITPADAVEASDVISRDPDSPWADGVVIRYAWDDRVMGTQVKYDTAGDPGKVIVLDYARPYPGPGAAAAVLTSVQAQGRTQEVRALMDGRASPGMVSVITVSGGGFIRGRIRVVAFDLAAGLMHVSSRDQAAITPEMIDALPGTIDALPGTIDALPGTALAQRPNVPTPH